MAVSDSLYWRGYPSGMRFLLTQYLEISHILRGLPVVTQALASTI